MDYMSSPDAGQLGFWIPCSPSSLPLAPAPISAGHWVSGPSDPPDIHGRDDHTAASSASESSGAEQRIAGTVEPRNGHHQQLPLSAGTQNDHDLEPPAAKKETKSRTSGAALKQTLQRSLTFKPAIQLADKSQRPHSVIACFVRKLLLMGIDLSGFEVSGCHPVVSFMGTGKVFTSARVHYV